MDVRRILRAVYREVLAFEAPIPRPFMRAFGNHAEAPIKLPVRGLAPPRRVAPLKERCERNAVALRRDLNAHRIAERREDVDVLREPFDDVPPHAVRTRIAH